MTRSSIEWTEVTWNPATGCDRISAGCDNCYALALAKRLKAMGSPRYQVDGHPRTSGPGFAVSEHPEALDTPRNWRSPRLVFVNSMSDLFHARISTDFISDVFKTMHETPQHTYQILTKRPKRAVRIAESLPWPANIWLGVTVENLDSSWRIDELRRTPAKVKFVSAEPLLGPLSNLNLGGIDWLIAGGESGPRFRQVDASWVRELRDSCTEQQVAFFFKQWGGRTPKANGRTLDGKTYDGMPQRQPLQSTPAASAS